MTDLHLCAREHLPTGTNSKIIINSKCSNQIIINIGAADSVTGLSKLEVIVRNMSRSEGPYMSRT